MKDKEGTLNINGVNVKWKFKASYFGEDSVPHLEFRSLIDSKPNLISETGYRSYFMGVNPDDYKTIEELISEFIKAIAKEENNQDYNLMFEKGEEVKFIQQQTLF